MTGHIYIYGEIVSYQAKDIQDHGYTSLRTVIDSFNNQKDSEDFVVHIHSVGGEVEEGLAIYDFLKNCGKPVTTKVEGMCASIASVILMAGYKREASKNSTVFIHNAWTVAMGDSIQLEKASRDLKEYTDIIKAVYKTNVSIDDELLNSLMNEETSLKSSQALEYGFITEITNATKAVAKINKKNMAFNLNSIKKSLGMDVTEPKKELVKNVMLTLEDGTQVESSSDESIPKVGDKITLEDGSKAPDADHVLESGYVVTTENGVITEVVEPQDEVVESDEVIALKNELESAKAENLELKESIKNSIESNKSLKSEFEETKKVLTEATKLYNILKNSSSVEINTEKKEETNNTGIKSRVYNNK